MMLLQVSAPAPVSIRPYYTVRRKFPFSEYWTADILFESTRKRDALRKAKKLLRTREGLKDGDTVEVRRHTDPYSHIVISLSELS